jgi:chromosome segregation ATPase
MRKIFYALAPTPKPCLKEEAAWEAAWDAWYKVEKILVKLNYNIMFSEARWLKEIPDELNKVYAEQAHWDQNLKKTNEEILANKQAINNIDKDRLVETPNYYNYLYREKQSLESTLAAIVKLSKTFDKQITSLKQESKNEIRNIIRSKAEQKIQQEAIKPLLYRRNYCFSLFNTCLINRNDPAPLMLNLNSSFKEIKQKIKTINKKLISLDNKLKNLNHGILSLNVLNINKNLSDEKIKFTKELIVKLDNLKPSFDVIYKKAQNDLSSYQKERKIFISKIKTAEEKIKTIPDKKKKLKAQISNLINNFKKTPPVI